MEEKKTSLLYKIIKGLVWFFYPLRLLCLLPGLLLLFEKFFDLFFQFFHFFPVTGKPVEIWGQLRRNGFEIPC